MKKALILGIILLSLLNSNTAVFASDSNIVQAHLNNHGAEY